MVVLAQEESRELGHTFIGAEHLLLGVVRVGVPVALDEPAVRAAVVASLGAPGGPVHGQIPFTKGAQGALEQSLVMTLERGERTIEPEHVLLALCADEAVMGVLVRSGFPAERVRAELAAAPKRVDAEPVTVGDELLGDLGNPDTDLRMLRAILRRGGRVAGRLRTAGINERWLDESGG